METHFTISILYVLTACEGLLIMFTVIYRSTREGWHFWSWLYVNACFARWGFHTHQQRDTCYISDVHDVVEYIFCEPTGGVYTCHELYPSVHEEWHHVVSEGKAKTTLWQVAEEEKFIPHNPQLTFQMSRHVQCDCQDSHPVWVKC